MTIRPILAENDGTILGILFLVAIFICLLSGFCVLMNFTFGKGRWWAFLIGLIPTVGGCLALLCFLGALREDPKGEIPIFLTFISAISFLGGLSSLYVWGLGQPNWSQTVGVALRVALYLGLGISFIALLLPFSKINAATRPNAIRSGSAQAWGVGKLTTCLKTDNLLP